MSDATKAQADIFRKTYCLSSKDRSNIINNFDVDIESFEELLPGNTIRSYATGNRAIEKGFLIFKATDRTNDITYYPVFSESVGRQLAKEWGLNLPPKMTVLVGECKESCGGGKTGKYEKRKYDNQKMILLIQFARSMMILHVADPYPMKDPFKSIYNKLQTHPNYDVFESDIKSVNTAIKNFLHSKTNKKNDNFTNLQQFISFLNTKYPNHKCKDHEFQALRDKMRNKYPDEEIVF